MSGVLEGVLEQGGCVEEESVHISADDLKRCLPKNINRNRFPKLVEQINGLIDNDEDMRNSLKDNLITYKSAILEGKYSPEHYINAVRFVTYRLLGWRVEDAWKHIFPDRHARLVSQGKDAKSISAHTGAYSKSKLVVAIFEQSLIPTHLLNHDIFQEAINTQATLMRDENVSPKVRSDAANSLLTHLKSPIVEKVELSIGVKQDQSITELRESVSALAKMQKDSILQGVSSVKDIAHSRLVGRDDGEA